MTVKELKEAIANLPDDMGLVLQIDPEGNGYSPVEGIDPYGILGEDGECYDATWTADEAGMEEDEWEELCKKPRVGIVYPGYF
jgi:hypothetical protein